MSGTTFDELPASLAAEIAAAKSNPVMDITVNDTTISVRRHAEEIIISRRHHVYLHDILTYFDHYYETVVPQRIHQRLVVDYSGPRWHKLRGSGERFYFSSFAEDIGSVRIYDRYLAPQPGDVVLDLGAYCGLCAVNFARSVGPNGRVLCYEPDPQNFAILQTNVTASGMRNITLHQNAVFGERGTLMFSSEGNMGSAVLASVAENRGNLVEVAGTTLADIVADNHLPKIDVVKMDIEGSEYSVMQNSIDFLARYRPRVAVELHAHPWPSGPAAPHIVRDVFDALGYFTCLVNPGMMIATPDCRGGDPVKLRAEIDAA